MRRLRKLRELSPIERHLLASAVVLVGSVRIALWLFPFRVLRPVLARAASSSGRGRRARPEVVACVPWAVATVAARVPGATCLTQALAAQILLAHCGEVSRLQIGVARAERGGVKAHAWLEHRGTVVLGDASLADFIPLSIFDTQAPNGVRLANAKHMEV